VPKVSKAADFEVAVEKTNEHAAFEAAMEKAKELLKQSPSPPATTLVGAAAVFLMHERVKVLLSLHARIRELEDEVQNVHRELADLKAKSLRYCGAWQRMQEYQRGDAVTHDGALWCATRDGAQAARPGSDDAWQLMHKSR
jgi:hypothetical protein